MVLSSLLCTRDKYLRLSKLTVQNFTHIFIDQKPKSYRSKNTMNVDKSYEVEPLLLKYGGTRRFHMSQSVPQMQKKGKTIRPEVVNLRVIAVFGVLFGHSTTIYWHNWDNYNTFVQSPILSHVENLGMLILALWMMISGFCIGFTFEHNWSFKEFFVRRFTRLIVPYFLVGALWMVPIRMLLHYPNYANESYWYIVWKYIILDYDSGQLWFLPTVFSYSIFLWIAQKILRTSWVRDILLLFFGVCLLLVPIIYHGPGSSVVHMPMFSPLFYYFTFFMIGFIVYNHENDIKRVMKAPILFIGAILMIISIIFMYLGRGRIGLQLIAVWGCLIILFFIMPHTTNRFTRAIADVSLGVYLFHEPLAFISYTYWPDIDPLLMVSINFFLWGTVASIISYLVFVLPKRLMRKNA